jgi:hypothetical protein
MSIMYQQLCAPGDVQPWFHSQTHQVIRVMHTTQNPSRACFVGGAGGGRSLLAVAENNVVSLWDVVSVCFPHSPRVYCKQVGPLPVPRCNQISCTQHAMPCSREFLEIRVTVGGTQRASERKGCVERLTPCTGAINAIAWAEGVVGCAGADRSVYSYDPKKWVIRGR